LLTYNIIKGYCSWYQCDGDIQNDNYCNFDAHNCLGECGGTVYCPVNNPPTASPSSPKDFPTVSPIVSTPVPTTEFRPSKTPTRSHAGCCTNDFTTCIDWCGTTKSECFSCTINDYPQGWIDGPQTDCIARWNVCTDDADSCCKGLTCKGSIFYRGCEYVHNPSTESPTSAPSRTIVPTGSPTSCTLKQDCNDQDVCTIDACLNGQCVNTAIRKCCVSQSDCIDNKECTKDICTKKNKCKNKNTCDDNNSCTKDICRKNGKCRFKKITNCECQKTKKKCKKTKPCCSGVCNNDGKCN